MCSRPGWTAKITQRKPQNKLTKAQAEHTQSGREWDWNSVTHLHFLTPLCLVSLFNTHTQQSVHTEWRRTTIAIREDSSTSKISPTLPYSFRLCLPPSTHFSLFPPLNHSSGAVWAVSMATRRVPWSLEWESATPLVLPKKKKKKSSLKLWTWISAGVHVITVCYQSVCFFIFPKWFEWPRTPPTTTNFSLYVPQSLSLKETQKWIPLLLPQILITIKYPRFSI